MTKPNYPDPSELPRFLRQRFTRRINGAKRKGASARVFEAIHHDFAEAQACQERRLANWPTWEWPADLPVVQSLDKLQQAISEHQVVVVAGETGSGKTTQLPKICLSLGLGREGIIGHTQPRRIAARSVGRRIAEELGGDIGEQVGYKVRFDDKSADHNLITLLTDGMLLAELQQDRLLSRYQVLIIDEAHERSLNIDFLLGVIKQLLPKRPDLKVIITSATIDQQRFADFFNEGASKDKPRAAVVEVSGRSYPVAVEYRPLAEEDDDLAGAILHAVEEIETLERQHKGGKRLDILVFLAGQRDIREAHLRLKKAQLFATEVLPLYSRLSPKEQNRVFAPHKGRRIVLATNVAETSLTVPGIGYVIDSGLARISRYSVASKVQRLPIEAVSQASAEQRAGRAGRIMPGVCFRLYDEADFNNRPEFTEPEIQRTNLASVILSMADARLGDIERFPFLDKPEGRLIRDGYKLLFELQAMDKRHRLTKLGRKLARFPLDPRLSRMLFAAQENKVLREALIIVAALGAQDPRERPQDKQQQADQAHQPFNDKRSDFLFFWNLWQWAEEQRAELSRSAYERKLRRTFLNPRRMREWRETHRQLKQLVAEQKWTLNKEPADYASLHQALLSGLATQIMRKDDDGEWLSCRNRKPLVWPGSAVKKAKARWLMAAEQVETSRLFGRTVAEIKPEWVMQAVPQLLKRSYYEPHWSRRHENAMVKERVSLFGLELSTGKRIPCEHYDKALARELMIREGLVERQLKRPISFVDKNHALVDKLRAIEHKMRRRDFLVDEEARADFYEAALPDDICNLVALRVWYKKANAADRKRLLMDEDFLLARERPDEAQQQFPDRLALDDMQLKLQYTFDPTGQRDGVTLVLPQALLGSFPKWRSDWLVPGLLAEKIEALLRALPKRRRRQVVPVPDYTRALLQSLTPDGPLLPALSHELRRMTGLRIEQEDWPLDKLPNHLRMNIRVVDERGKTLQESRDWEALAGLEQDGVAPVSQEKEPASTGEWVFGDIAPNRTENLAGTQVTRYPALVDEGKQVALRLFNDADEAAYQQGWGLARLFVLQRPDIVKRLRKQAGSLAGFQRLQADKSAFSRRALDDTLLLLVRHSLALADADIRNENVWQAHLKQRLGDAMAQLDTGIKHFAGIFDAYGKTRARLKKNFPLQLAHVHKDISTQLNDLFHEQALRDWPWDWWQQMSRYMQALQSRLDKLDKEDRARIVELAECREQYLTRAAKRPFRQQPEALQRYRLMLEELRVGLYAQQLGTQFTVSFKRLNKQWQNC